MKNGFYRTGPLIFLLLIIIGLIAINGCLYKRNKAYLRENRELIIQNDSILSINIELNEALQNHKTAAAEGLRRK